MKFIRRAIFMYLLPAMAFALSISVVTVSHSAGFQARTDAALTATGQWQLDNKTTIPWGTVIQYVWNDKWTEDGTYSLDGNDQHQVTLHPLTQKAPGQTASGGGVPTSCTPTYTVYGDYFTTTATQGGEVISQVTEFEGSSVSTSGCEFTGPGY